jgi:hypothetical protein
MKSILISTLFVVASLFIVSANAADSAAPYPYERQQVIVCQSQNYQTNMCYSSIRRVRTVRLLNQYSKTRCIGGRTFFARPNGVMVARGCSGRFLVRGL